MAVYIYHERYDSAGEGVRAELSVYATQEHAHTVMGVLREDDQVIRAQMIVGSIVEEFEPTDQIEAEI